MRTKIRLPYSLFLISWVLVLVIALSGFVLFGGGQQLISSASRDAAKFTLAASVLGYIVVSLRIRSSLIGQRRSGGGREMIGDGKNARGQTTVFR